MILLDNYYEADEDKTFIVKETKLPCGFIIYLGSTDSIDNYEEVELTEENDICHRKFGKEEIADEVNDEPSEEDLDSSEDI